MFEKKYLFLLIIIRVDLEDCREISDAGSAVSVVRAPVVVVPGNIRPQQKPYKLPAGKYERKFYKVRSNYKCDDPLNYSLSFLKVGTMTDFLATAGL